MRILCIAKDSHILSAKNNSVFVIFMFEILTNRSLTMSLILNNWAQVVQPDCTAKLRHEIGDQYHTVLGPSQCE